MSSAFVKESEEQWLHDIPPTLNALVIYLTREIMVCVRVYERSSFADTKSGKTVHVMSNDGNYSIDDGKWRML